MTGIFLCYSRVDKPITEHLANLLRKAYDHVWFDENLHGGEEWWSEILKEISTCRHFVFIMSDDAIESEWCMKELAEAQRLNRHIIPILVRARTEIPPHLDRIQHIDMSLGMTVDSINQLYATLIRDVPTRTDNKALAADSRIVERLWMFINGRYIEVMNEQVQHARIDWDSYTSHVSKYLDLRAKARDTFYNRPLEEAFEAFDDALIKLDGQIGWTYQLLENNGRAFMAEPSTARDDSYWFEKYNRLVRRAADVWMRHVELVRTIRQVLPEFDLNRDY